MRCSCHPSNVSGFATLMEAVSSAASACAAFTATCPKLPHFFGILRTGRKCGAEVVLRALQTTATRAASVHGTSRAERLGHGCDGRLRQVALQPLVQAQITSKRSMDLILALARGWYATTIRRSVLTRTMSSGFGSCILQAANGWSSSSSLNLNTQSMSLGGSNQ